MTKLSICIPLEAGAADPVDLVQTLLAASEIDLDVVLAGTADATAKITQRTTDPRLQIVTTEPDLTRQQLWRQTIAASTGDWVTLVNPGDMIEAELALMVAYLEQTSPSVDALAWNVFQIDRGAEAGKASSVAVPTGYHIDSFDKMAMLKAFFHWEGSLQAPKMPFGVHHATIRRSLADAILALPASDDWTTPVPQYEWAAKVLLFATELAFCSRPLSVASTSAYVAPSELALPWNFPFHAGLGLTGAVAEVQFHALRELGNVWGGGDAAFVRACMIDCMMETTQEKFRAKGNAYFAALQQFEGGRLASQFQPQFAAQRPGDRRRGLHGEALLIDRFVGGARTAPEFYDVVKSILAPVGLICGGVAR